VRAKYDLDFASQSEYVQPSMKPRTLRIQIPESSVAFELWAIAGTSDFSGVG